METKRAPFDESRTKIRYCYMSQSSFCMLDLEYLTEQVATESNQSETYFCQVTMDSTVTHARAIWVVT